jgi:hypothetical protein
LCLFSGSLHIKLVPKKNSKEYWKLIISYSKKQKTDKGHKRKSNKPKEPSLIHEDDYERVKKTRESLN